MIRLTLIYGSLAFAMMLFVLLHQKPEAIQPEASTSISGGLSEASIPRDRYDR
jgi:hypothetical protein